MVFLVARRSQTTRMRAHRISQPSGNLQVCENWMPGSQNSRNSSTIGERYCFGKIGFFRAWDFSGKKHVLEFVLHWHGKVQANDWYDTKRDFLPCLLVCEGVKEINRKAKNIVAFLHLLTKLKAISTLKVMKEPAIMHLSQKCFATVFPCCIHFVLETRTRSEFHNVVLETECNKLPDRYLNINFTKSLETSYVSATLAAVIEQLMDTEKQVVRNRWALLIYSVVQHLAIVLWTNSIYDLHGAKLELLGCSTRVLGEIRKEFLVINSENSAILKQAKLNDIVEHR